MSDFQLCPIRGCARPSCDRISKTCCIPSFSTGRWKPKLMVVTGRRGLDDRSTRRHQYLDGWPGLVRPISVMAAPNLPEVAAEQMRHCLTSRTPAMNCRPLRWPRKINGADGRALHTPTSPTPVPRRNEARLQRSPAIHEARIPGGKNRFKTHQPLIRPITAPRCGPWTRGGMGEAQAKFEPFGRLRACRPTLLLSLPVRPSLPSCGRRLRQEHGEPRSSARDLRRWPR